MYTWPSEDEKVDRERNSGGGRYEREEETKEGRKSQFESRKGNAKQKQAHDNSDNRFAGVFCVIFNKGEVIL
jgi:hypothetical protein